MPPVPFATFGFVLSLISPIVAWVLFVEAANAEPIMVWVPNHFFESIVPPLLVAIIWACWLGRLLVAHRPQRATIGWALAIV